MQRLSLEEASALREVTNVTGERRWWNRFFEKYAEFGIVTVAAKAAGVSKKTVYENKKMWPEFVRRWEEAEDQSLSALEDAAHQRALKTSDPLLMFLLKAKNREKYGDTLNINILQKLAKEMRDMPTDDLLHAMGYEPDASIRTTVGSDAVEAE